MTGAANVSTLGGNGGEENGSHVGGICCDRTQNQTDICYMKGDIRTGSGDKPLSIFLYNVYSREHLANEKIRPYTKKSEESIMSTIDELTLVPISKNGNIV